MVFLCLFLDNFSLYMLAPILDDVVSITGSTKENATMLYCIKPIIALPFSIVTGKFVCLIGPRFTAGIGIACFFICCWVNAVAGSIWTWALARVIQSIGSALTVGAGMYLIGLVTDETNRGKYMGLAYAGNALGVFAGPFVGSWLFHTHGQFIVYSSLSSLAALQLALFLILAFDKSDTFNRSKVKCDKTPFRIWKLLLSNRPMICLMIAAGSACTVLGLVEPVLPHLIKNRFKLSDAEVDNLWACGTLFYPLTVPVAGYLSDCLPRHRLLQIGLAGFACVLPLWSLICDYEWGVRIYLALIFSLDAVVDAPVQPLIASVVEGLGLTEGGSIGFTLGDMAQNFGYLVGPFLSREVNETGEPQVLMLIMASWFVAVFIIVSIGFFTWRKQPMIEEVVKPEIAESSTTTVETTV